MDPLFPFFFFPSLFFSFPLFTAVLTQIQIPQWMWDALRTRVQVPNLVKRAWSAESTSAMIFFLSPMAWNWVGGLVRILPDWVG